MNIDMRHMHDALAPLWEGAYATMGITRGERGGSFNIVVEGNDVVPVTWAWDEGRATLSLDMGDYNTITGEIEMSLIVMGNAIVNAIFCDTHDDDPEGIEMRTYDYMSHYTFRAIARAPAPATQGRDVFDDIDPRHRDRIMGMGDRAYEGNGFDDIDVRPS